MISGVISQGMSLPRGALFSSGAYLDLESIASPRVVGADSQVASSGLFTDADGFFAPKSARGVLPAFKSDDGSIFAPRLRQSQVLQPALYVAVDVLSLPAVALPGILQTHLYTVDDAVFAPFISTHGSLRPGMFNAFDAFYAPTVVAAQTLLPNLYTASDVFYTPTRRTTVGPARVIDSEVIYAPAIPVFLYAGLISDAETFFVPIVGFPATLNGPVVGDITMSSGNLKATHTANDTYSGVRSATVNAAGKFYCEFTAGQITGGYTAVGVVTTSVDYVSLTPFAYVAVNASNCFVGINGSTTAYTLGTSANGDVFGVAVDLNARLIWFRKNGGLWNGNTVANPSTGVNGSSIPVGSLAPSVRYGIASISGDNITANFGQSAFSWPPPAGFGIWIA